MSMRYPGIFSMEDLTAFQDKVWFRTIVFFMLIAAFVFAMLSLILRETKSLGTFGMAATLLASLLGGSTTSSAYPITHRYIWGSISSSSMCCSLA